MTGNLIANSERRRCVAAKSADYSGNEKTSQDHFCPSSLFWLPDLDSNQDLRVSKK
jgi:hypothetical protein